MASKKKQRGMGCHEEGGSTPVGERPPACFAALRPCRTYEGRKHCSGVTNEEAATMAKPNTKPSEETAPVRLSDGKLLATSDGLSAACVCKGIRVTLDNNSMWNEFFNCRTEMILTKQGSRMFPYCRFRLSGLQPSRRYSLLMDIQLLDNNRYEWTGSSWQVAGKAGPQVKNAPFAHPESPSTGQHWMQSPVSFYKLKLTNNPTDQEGNTILSPMHRYLPRLHVVQTDKPTKDINLNSTAVCTFTFPQTEFMAVTAYQNRHFAQLKVDCNPFAKGLKEDVSTLKGSKLKLNTKKDADTTANKLLPVKKSLKSLLENHKPRTSKTTGWKPSVSGDPHATNSTESVLKISEEHSRSPPAQKLISELIREAHVSLQRCSLDQLSIHNNILHTTEQRNTNTTTLKHNGHKSSKSATKPSETPPANQGEDGVKTRRFRQDSGRSLSCRNNTRTSHIASSAPTPSSAPSPAPSASLNSSVDSDLHPKPSPLSEDKVKLHKRPAPLPLPALALFLKQHSTKTKKVKSTQDSLTKATPSQPAAEPPSQPAAEPPSQPAAEPPSPSEPPSELLSKPVSLDPGPIKDLSRELMNTVSSPADEHVSPDAAVLKVHVQADEPCQSGVEAPATSDSNEQQPVEASVSDPEGDCPTPDDSSLVLSNSGDPLCPFSMSSSLIHSSSCEPALPVHISPPLDQPALKADSLLPDPECSFVFESLSPVSSPSLLPSLPVSLTLDLDSQTSEHEALHSEDDSASVFKWHTVLPQPEPYVGSSFTTFQPTPQTLPLASDSSPMLPSETTSLPEPQSLHPATPQPEMTPPFQVNEQSLPFPAELSPLALQLPLSPTFSSLDGDALSPTPSLADLVHFFSIDDDLGIGVEFSNSEVVSANYPPPVTGEAVTQESPQQLQTVQAGKPGKRKKKSRRKKVSKTLTDQETDISTYTCMQPNLEKVEEQLFISFTSKEALKLHITDSTRGSVSQTTPQDHLRTPESQTRTPEGQTKAPEGQARTPGGQTRTPEGQTKAPEGQTRTPGGQTKIPQDRIRIPEGHLITPEAHLQTPEYSAEHDGLEEEVASSQKILLRDLKVMRHRQVIHPVLQAVGLKMNLLDPAQAVDLQYLGVRLPLPLPGLSENPPNPGVCSAFVSRTGKTTDVTQIKGWREKFSPSETPVPPVLPEAGPSSDLQKKNLSAFCSDMLDEYLENEGKLIDERADSFAQPQLDPPVYQLPTTSTSYVRTLDSVLKKQTTSELISGFIPPSKRPKFTLKESRTSRRETPKPRGPKPHKPRLESTPVGSSLAESNLDSKQHTVPVPDASPPSAAPPMSTAPSPSGPLVLFSKPKRLKPHPRDPFGLPQTPMVKKRRKLKSMSQSPFHTGSSDPSLLNKEGLDPLESDSELTEQGRLPLMTRALLRQKDLEEGAVWEGNPRTRITKDRAAIALTSLFTLKGFVVENPTTPVQVSGRPPPPCLNEFCRLGCVCVSLSYCYRISHCGRPACMLGCSCLKQKVVLLKNLEPDSSPSHQGARRRRKRRMKMAYVLKEADSVSQPAERVRTLWKRSAEDSEPIHTPKPGHRPHPPSERSEAGGCARVRVYHLKRRSHKLKKAPEERRPEHARLKCVKLKEAHSPTPSADTGTLQALGPGSELAPKPSKRLIILAEGKWGSAADRSQVLTHLCERMARDQLNQPFMVRGYRITPISQTAEGTGADSCVQYRVHISRLERERDNTPGQNQRKQKEVKEGWKQNVEKEEANPMEDFQQEVEQDDAEPMEDWQREVEQDEAEPIEDWQREVEQEEAETMEDWQREVEEEEVEPMEDWQRKVQEEEAERQEVTRGGEVESEGIKADGWSIREEEITSEKERMVSLGLPFLTGVSPAGFLSTNRKQPGGTDHLIQVNGKPYPLAKIQLGLMGALHPANRLAAYLTGRVGSARKQPGSTPTPPQNLRLPPNPTASSSSMALIPSPKPQSSVTVLAIQAAPTDSHLPVTLHQSAASSHQPATEKAGPRLMTVKLYPHQIAAASQLKALPTASLGSTHQTGSGSPKVTQLVMVPAPGLVPCSVPNTHGPAPPSPGPKMILKPVQTTSRDQIYRRPDGKLVRLVPISQLRPVPRDQPMIQGQPKVQYQSVTQSVQKVSCQTPVLTVGLMPHQTVPLAPLPIRPHSPSLGPVPAKAQPPVVGAQAQKGTCSFKIVPSDTSKEPVIVTCVKVPPPPPTKVVTGPAPFTLLQSHPSEAPTNLLSLSQATGGGAGLGVKTVSVAPGGVVVHSKPQTIIQAPAMTSPPPSGLLGVQVPPRPSPPTSELPVVQVRSRTQPHPLGVPGSEVTSLPDRTRQEQKSNLVDLDATCTETEVVTTGMVDRARPGSVTVDLEGSETTETENSSDLEDETDEELEPVRTQMSSDQRLTHNLMERERRGKLRNLFKRLRSELGQEEKTPKVHILKKAAEVIQNLRTTETSLTRLKRILTKRRDDYLCTIAPSTDLSLSGSKEAEPLTDTEDERTENSSDEDVAVTSMTNKMTSHLNPGRTGLSDSKEGFSDRKSPSDQRVHAAFTALRSVLNDHHSAETQLLRQARREIRTLECEMNLLKSLKICLKQQRDAYRRKISAGQINLRISRKQLPSNQLPVAHIGGVFSSADDDITSQSSDQQQLSEAPPAMAPPTDSLSVKSEPVSVPVLAPPTVTPAQTPEPLPVPLLAPPSVSQNAPVLRDRARTIPNILSRSKKTMTGSPSFQALVPSEVLSFVPVQPILTMNPMMSQPAVLQTSTQPGVATVTLNITGLTNQQIHLTPLSCPQTATNVNNLMQLVQPSTQLASEQQQADQQPPNQHQQLAAHQPLTQLQSVQQPAIRQCDESQPTGQQQQPTGQQQQPTGQQPMGQQQQPTGQQPMGQQQQPTGQQRMGQQQQPTGQQRMGQQQQPTGQQPMGQQQQPTGQQPKGQQLTPPPQECPTESSPILGSGLRAATLGGGADGLTSLLDEIHFLNQQPIISETTQDEAELQEECGTLGGEPEQGGPWLLELDSDSDDAVPMEKAETADSQSELRHVVKTPPPLLQMKVGGAREAELSSSEGGGDRGREEGVSWRPMPRLVPLGLRGHATN
ncbi:MAX dimerization protein MGA a isoform X3 [Cheilinus undulatus]|uniref:MAX dimerization protein MGA a isoform X3 n=1 Tax=Cheilinus undulatus TaxID=241271 RepID=UPI001BD60E85|nr:MAX dimerization protein MGA a isoform X3 [Cheilinus undulatus]